MRGRDPFAKLPEGLPAGRLISSPVSGVERPVLWLSDRAGPEMGRWWRLALAQHPQTRLYPLLVGNDDRLDLVRAVTVDVIDALTVDEILGPYFEFFGQPWPHPAMRRSRPVRAVPSAFGILAEICSRHRLGLVPARRGADTIALFGWGGPANRYDSLERLSIVLRSWEDRYGMQVIALGRSTLDVSVNAPPTTLSEAHWVAMEHEAFCPDIWQILYPYLEDHDVLIEKYAAELVNRRRWHFWWD